MEPHDESKTLADLLDPGMTMMVGTLSPAGRLEARPLTVAKVAGDTIRVLVDTTKPKSMNSGIPRVEISDHIAPDDEP
jgi:hypothetical protein